MQLVILAAGHGTRFGGLKQLAPVGPNGEAIMDYTARSAASCGFEGIVLVVREAIRAEIQEHVRRRWSAELPIAIVCQPPFPGTAQAVLSARPALDGPFAVANADDHYGEVALASIAQHFAVTKRPYIEAAGDAEPPVPAREEHLLVAYRLVNTVLTAAPVTRGLCEVGVEQNLLRIVEHRVRLLDDGRFEGKPVAGSPAARRAGRRVLTGAEPVSMNLWGFHARFLEHLEEALASVVTEAEGQCELLLPTVVGSLVADGRDTVAVIETTARCIGITHKEDIPIVRSEIALEFGGVLPLQALHGS